MLCCRRGQRREDVVGSYGRQAGIYDGEYRNFHDDVDFYLDRLHSQRVRGPVLDLGCGTGRVSVPLATAGHRVTGIDRSRPMLRRAWRRRAGLAAEVAMRLRFSLQDMASFAFPRRFAVAVAAFSTFNMLTEPADRRACLARVAAHLEPGGLLLLDLIATGQAPPTGRRFTSSFLVPPRGDVVHKEVEEGHDPSTGLTHVRYGYEVRGYADDRLRDRFDVDFATARLSRSEVEGLLYEAGFDVEEVVGDYRGNPISETSPRMLVQARLA